MNDSSHSDSDGSSDIDYDFDQNTNDYNPLTNNARDLTIKTATNIPSYEELYNKARELWPTGKPSFAQERRGIEDGDLKEVVLAEPDGKNPGSSPSVPRPVLTAIRWDAKYFLWVLDRGTEKFIMKAAGGTFRRCLGIDGKKKALYEKRNFAWPVPDPPHPDPPPRLPSSPIIPDSDPGVPEHFMNRSPFQYHETELPIMPRKGQRSPKIPAVVVPVPPTSSIQDTIQQDRAYYESRNGWPPYVKRASKHRKFVAVLADQDENPSEHQIHLEARQWSDGHQYWIANIHGQERIVNLCNGGRGGWRLRLWLGYEEHEQGTRGAVIGFPPPETEGELSGQSTKRSSEDRPVAQSTRQRTMPPRAHKLARRSEPLTRRYEDTLSTTASARNTRQQSQIGPTSAQVDNKIRTSKGRFRKSTGTTGYKVSPVVGQTLSDTVTGAPALAPALAPTDVGNGGSAHSLPPPNKRSQAVRACDSCREHRSKCDNNQPCFSCRHRGEHCSNSGSSEVPTMPSAIRSAGEPSAIESTDNSVPSANASTNTGPSPEELLRQKREIQRKQLLVDRKLLSLDMEDNYDQLKKAGVVV